MLNEFHFEQAQKNNPRLLRQGLFFVIYMGY